ncbi:MAG TPA: LuxR C-terminal-related transcriptional regulator [Acidimicrobiales bacterium]|nr:LuxR C-terminal-related transcriptional regulator [Acidimicrobiales bacterium]
MAEDPDGLEAAAEARYRAFDYAGARAGYEGVYRAYRTGGDRLGAARVARILAWLNANIHGDWAVASGWIGRARSFLDEAGPDSAEHGWSLVMSADPDGDPIHNEAICREALALARRHGDADLEFEALGHVALALCQAGRVQEGLVLVDEVLAAVTSGEVEDLYVIEACICGMFLACERANDVVRAEQWLRTIEDERHAHLVGVAGFCRAHYGGLLTAAGRWQEAEAELTDALRLLDASYVGMRGSALVRLADLRVHQGRYEEARELLSGLEDRPDAFRPRAAIHYAEGELALARDLLERALAQPDMAAIAGPVLALLVDVELADGAVSEARLAAERLAALAERQPGHYLRAAAALARGKVCVAEGSPDARACLEAALASFAQAQMPLALAQARLELARAVASERPEVAVAEASGALAAFEELHAARNADAAAALLRRLGGPARTGPRRQAPLTRREEEVLDLLGHGLSNPEIADRLYISRKTVEHHVGRVLTKLGLRSRAEAAAYATRRSAPK